MCRDFLNFTLGAENQRTVSISGRSEICKVTITGEKVSPMTLSTWRKRADSKRKLEVKKKKKSKNRFCLGQSCFQFPGVSIL